MFGVLAEPPSAECDRRHRHNRRRGQAVTTLVHMMNSDWIEHRRGGDGERLGWMLAAGDGFVAVDLLGRHRTETVDWLTAEETIDELGIGYLGDAYELRLDDGQWLRVRLVEISSTAIIAKQEDWGDMNAPQIRFTLPFPITDALRVYSPA